MILSSLETAHFYRIWKPLLFYVNEQGKILPGLHDPDQILEQEIKDLIHLRDVLWADDGLREAFCAQNPFGLTQQDLAIVESWKYRRAGKFFVFKYLKKHAILIDERNRDVLAFKGLESPPENVIGPYPPVLAEMVLLPFGAEIIYDSLVRRYNVTFGGGIRRELKEIYDDAKERGEIITSLLPGGQVSSPEEQAAQASATNKKILLAFQKYLAQSGQSLKIIERDLATAQVLAGEIARLSPSTSLRDLAVEHIQHHLGSLPAAERRPAGTGLKRLVKFLRDTGRLDYNDAEYLLAELKL